MDPKPVLNEKLLGVSSGRKLPPFLPNGKNVGFPPNGPPKSMLERGWEKISGEKLSGEIKSGAEGIIVKNGFELEVEYIGPTKNNEFEFLVLAGEYNGKKFIPIRSHQGRIWDFYMPVKKKGGKKTKGKTKKRYTRKRV